MLVNDHPGVCLACQNRGAASAFGSGRATNESRPFETEDTSGNVCGLYHPYDLTNPVFLILDRLKTRSRCLLNLGFSNVGASVANPVDRVVTDQSESAFELVGAGGRFVFYGILLVLSVAPRRSKRPGAPFQDGSRRGLWRVQF